MTSVQDKVEIPKKFSLNQNYPNPFNPETTIKYELPKTSKVKLQIFNILGQKIKTLVDEEKQPGYYSVKWNGINDYGVKVSSGIYIYRLNKGISIDEYKKWSVEEDQKTINSFEGIESFEVFAIKDPEKEWDIFEVIRVESWKRWREIAEEPKMKMLHAKFEKLVDQDSKTRFYGEQIK